MLKTFI